MKPIANDKLPAVIRAGQNHLSALMPPGSGTHPLWGVEQVYMDRSYSRKIIVKRGVQLTEQWPVGGWSKVGNAFVLHLRRPDGITAFFADGFSNIERLEIERQIRGAYKTAGLIDLVLPRADASEAVGGAPRANQPRQPSEKTVELAGNGDGLTMCIAKMTGKNLLKKGEDAWETTKNVASSIYNKPLGAAEKAANYISSGASKVYETGKSVVNYVGTADPKKVYSDVSSAITKTYEFGEQLYAQAKSQIAEFDSWPKPIKDAVLCQVVAQAAADQVLQVALSATGVGAGAALAKLALVTKSIYDKLKAASSTIQTLIAAKHLDMSTKVGMVKDLMSGKRTREAVEVAMKEDGKATGVAAKAADAASDANPVAAKAAEAIAKEAPAPPQAPAPAPKEASTSSVKNLSPEELEKVQASNRALSKTDREAAIEKQLGMKPGSLTPEQKALIDKVHNTDCATRKCTAEEIKAVKDLKTVKAAFPDATPQQIKDLYRSNLLGRDIDDKEFAALMKSSFRPAAVHESSEAIAAAEHVARKQALKAATDEVAVLESKANVSPIDLAEARNHRDVLKRQIDAVGEPISASDKADFEKLMKGSFRPSERTPAAAGEASSVSAASLFRKMDAKPVPKPAAVTEAERKEFSAYLKTQKFNPQSRTAFAKASEQVQHASPSNPVPARFVSTLTGREVKGEIIGTAAKVEGNAETKVLFRSRGEDGRVTTREEFLHDVAVGEGGAVSRQAKSAEEKVDALVREAQSNKERIQQLEAEAQKAMRPGGGGLEQLNKIESERSALVKVDAPLDHREVRAIEAVSQAFSREGLAQRLPLKLTPTGEIQIRPGGGMQSIGLAPAEKADLARVQKIIETRRSAPRAIEDKPYFERAQSLNETNLVRARIREQQTQIRQQIEKVAGQGKMELSPYAHKYNPVALSKSYGADSQYVKDQLATIHKIVSKPDTTLSSSEMTTIQRSLSTLRSARYHTVVEQNPALKEFLDYSAARAGHSRLIELNSLVGH